MCTKQWRDIHWGRKHILIGCCNLTINFIRHNVVEW